MIDVLGGVIAVDERAQVGAAGSPRPCSRRGQDRLDEIALATNAGRSLGSSPGTLPQYAENHERSGVRADTRRQSRRP